MTAFMAAAPGRGGRLRDEEEEELHSCLPLQPATSLFGWLLLPVACYQNPHGQNLHGQNAH